MTTKVFEHEEGYIIIRFSSLVEAVVLPLPPELYQRKLKKFERDFPEPKPPTIEVSAVGGTELIEVKNLESIPASGLSDDERSKLEEAVKNYTRKVEERETKQAELMIPMFIKYCLKFDSQILANPVSLDDMRDFVENEFDDDDVEPDSISNFEAKKLYVTNFVLRTKDDYKKLMYEAFVRNFVDDEEVKSELEGFLDNI